MLLMFRLSIFYVPIRKKINARYTIVTCPMLFLNYNLIYIKKKKMSSYAKIIKHGKPGDLKI